MRRDSPGPGRGGGKTAPQLAGNGPRRLQCDGVEARPAGTTRVPAKPTRRTSGRPEGAASGCDMGCTTPLLGQLCEQLVPETGELTRQVQIRGVYTDARNERWAVPEGADHRKWTNLKLPCGKCPDCQSRHKLLWTHRCWLEASQHREVTFATLTYETAPWTLAVRDLQLFNKRLRTNLNRLRTLDRVSYKHFSCGEYGETTGRPHYHAILFGLGERHYEAIEKAWGHGFTHLEPAGRGAIAYVAGYVNKKRELLTADDEGWQNPFIVMSRGGRLGTGIAGDARRWRDNWREYAVMNGKKIPLSRYLHDAWKKTATAEETEQLELTREEYRKLHGTETDSTRRARANETTTRLLSLIHI